MFHAHVFPVDPLGACDIEDQLEKLQTILSAKGRSYSNPILATDGSVDERASRRVEFKFRLKDADMLDKLSTALDAEC